MTAAAYSLLNLSRPPLLHLLSDLSNTSIVLEPQLPPPAMTSVSPTAPTEGAHRLGSTSMGSSSIIGLPGRPGVKEVITSDLLRSSHQVATSELFFHFSGSRQQ